MYGMKHGLRGQIYQRGTEGGRLLMQLHRKQVKVCYIFYYAVE